MPHRSALYLQKSQRHSHPSTYPCVSCPTWGLSGWLDTLPQQGGTPTFITLGTVNIVSITDVADVNTDVDAFAANCDANVAQLLIKKFLNSLGCNVGVVGVLRGCCCIAAVRLWAD